MTLKKRIRVAALQVIAGTLALELGLELALVLALGLELELGLPALQTQREQARQRLLRRSYPLASPRRLWTTTASCGSATSRRDSWFGRAT